jgi:hypothetical protein
MFLAVLRASYSGEDLAPRVAAAGLKLDRSWVAGETDRHGRCANESGFNLSVADVESSATLGDNIRTFLRKHSSLLRQLVDAGASLVLDIGVTVGSDDQFTASVSIETDELSSLAGLEIALQFSAYPSS